MRGVLPRQSTAEAHDGLEKAEGITSEYEDTWIEENVQQCLFKTGALRAFAVGSARAEWVQRSYSTKSSKPPKRCP